MCPQPYAVYHKAGHQTAAESWGTGRAVSRIPRVPGGGTHRAGQGAFGNMCRGGHMYSPTKVRRAPCAAQRRRRGCAACGGRLAGRRLSYPRVLPSSRRLQIWRRWHRKINIKQKRYAVASALAASALPSLVMARGHKIDGVPEVPLVVSNAAEALSKTSAALALLRKIGAYADAAKSKESKNLHKGKGKMRNRRYTQRRGPLVVYGNDLGIAHAFRNIPGVELAHVERLNLLQLAPGGHMGRFVIWTKAAFEKLDSVFGTLTTSSAQKKGFRIPRSVMANADLNRVINSDEIQSVVNAPKDHHVRASLKKNPLRNLGALLKLNPYAKARPVRRPPRAVADVQQFPYWNDPAALGGGDEAKTLLCILRHPRGPPPLPSPFPLVRSLPLPPQTQRRMQILADTKRAEAKAAGKAIKRAKPSAEVKAAGQTFYESMIVDSAYDGELCQDFQAWLAKA